MTLTGTNFASGANVAVTNAGITVSNLTMASATTGGAVSSLGNSVQYLFDWGDGTTSGWLAVGTTSASHQRTATGSYTVKAYAASSASLVIQSSASVGLTVRIQLFEL